MLQHLTLRCDSDPLLALVGDDDDGLGCYRRLLPDVWHLLEPGGRLVVEMGTGRLGTSGRWSNLGFSDIQVIRDLGGIERCLCASKATSSACFSAF